MEHFKTFSVLLLLVGVFLQDLLVLAQVTPNFLADSLQASSDLFTQDLLDKYIDVPPSEYWQPYVYGTEDDRREVVRVKRVEKKSITGNYLQWKHARLGTKHFIVGLTRNSVDIYNGSDLKKITSIASSQVLVASAVFTKWDDELNQPEIIIPVATDKPNIEVYKFVGGVITKLQEDWPLQYQIKSLEYSHVGLITKLVLVPSKVGPINIYNIAVNGTKCQIWYHQRLQVNGQSHVAVYDVGPDSTIAIADEKLINVYTFDSAEGQHSLVQSVSINAPCTQLVAFTLAYKHYLVSIPAGNQPPEFFNYVFHQYKRIVSALDISTNQIQAVKIEDYRDEHILLAREPNGQIKFLSYDWKQKRFEEGYDCSDSLCPTESDLENGVSFPLNETTLFIFPSKGTSQVSEVLVIWKETQEALSPLYDQSAGSLDNFKSLSADYDRWWRIVSQTLAVLQECLSTARPNTLTGVWSLPRLSAQRVFAKFGENGYKGYSEPDYQNLASVFENFEFLDISWREVDFSTLPSDLDSKLEELKKLIYDGHFRLRDSIPLDSDERHVVRSDQYVSGRIRTDSLKADSVEVDAINSATDVTSFLNSLVQKQRSIDIKSPVTFTGALSVGNLQTTELNGIAVETFARLSKANIFDCRVEFKNKFTANGNILTAEINGIELAEQIIRIADISGVKFVGSVVAFKEATITSPIDTIVVRKDLFDQILLKSTDQTISAKFTFTDVILKGDALVVNINGENFKAFADKVITYDFSGIIRGSKTVSESLEADQLRIDSYLNGLSFPNGFITVSQKTAKVSGLKNFEKLTSDKVILDGEVNSINTKDLVSRLAYGNFKAKWTFRDEVKFLDDLAVSGSVDGVKMDALKHKDTLDQRKSSFYPDADIEFKQAVSFRALTIQSLINHKPSEDIFSGILLFKQPTTRVGGRTKIKGSLALESVTVKSGRVNNLELNDIFTLNTDQTITGSKLFEQGASFDSLKALTTLDGIELSKLFENAFRLSETRTISSKLSFDTIQCGSDLTVQGPINNFKDFASSVALASGPKVQTFTTDLEFENFSAKSLKISDHLNVPGGKTVGELDISKWYSQRISLSRNTKISYGFEVLGTSVVKGDLKSKRINGVPVSYLFSGVLRTDKAEQTFLEDFETTDLIQVKDGEIRIEREVNGYDINEIFQNAFSLTKDNAIRSSWIFKSIAVKGQLTVKGLVCHVDLKSLEQDSVKNGESKVYISGEIKFDSTFYVQKHLTVDRINSFDLFSNVFTLHTPQVLYGQLHVSKDVQVHNLVSHGKINDVSLSWLESIYSCENGTTHVLKDNMVAEGSIQCASLEAHGLIQGRNFKEYIEKNLVTTQTEGRITGEKTFLQQVVFEKDLNVQRLNGINLEDLSASIIRKSESVTFTKPVSFEKITESPNLVVSYGDVKASGLVGNINLTELTTNALYISPDLIRNTQHFESILVLGSVDDVETLNRIPISSLFTLETDQDLGSISVKEAYLTGNNVEVGGLINGYDLQKEFSNTLLGHSQYKQFVTGLKEFTGTVIFNNNLYCIDNLRDRLTLLDQNTIIESPVEFAQTVIVTGDLVVRKNVNGENLDELLAEALTSGRTEEITGQWDFGQGITFEQPVEGSTSLDGFILGELVDEKRLEANEVERLVQAETLKFEKSCDELNQLHAQVAHGPKKLAYFDRHQTLSLARPAERIIVVSSNHHLHLLTYSDSCEVTVFSWSETTESDTFELRSTNLRLGSVYAWDSASHQSIGILGFITRSTSCSSVSTGLWVVILQSDGSYSDSKLLSKDEFAGIQVVSDESEGRTVLLALSGDGSKLYAYEWDGAGFELKSEQELESPIVKFKAALFKNEVGIGYNDGAEIHYMRYAWDESFIGVAWGKFLGSTTNSTSSTLAVFESHNAWYTVIQSHEALKSGASIQPDCALQVFQHTFNNVELHLQHRIQSYTAISLANLKFANHDYLAVLSPTFGVSIYHFMGLSGFQLLDQHPLKIPNAIELVTFQRKVYSYEMSRPFIVALTPRTIEIYSSKTYGDSIAYPHPLYNNLCITH